MAINKIDNAEYLDADWQNEIITKNLLKRGFDNIELIEESGDFTVKSGSYVEYDGVFYEIDSDTLVNKVMVSGYNYLIFYLDGSEPIIEIIPNKDFEYNYSKRGYYDADGKKFIYKIFNKNKEYDIYLIDDGKNLRDFEVLGDTAFTEEYYSTDGINWDDNSFSYDGNWQFLDSSGGAAVGISQDPFDNSYYIYRTTDGINWTETETLTLSYVGSIIYGLKYIYDQFVFTSSNSRLYTSSDGNTWVEASSSTPEALISSTAFYYDSKYYFQGNSSEKLYYTSDLASFTEVKELSGPIVGSIVESDKVILALESGDIVESSSDGTTWTVIKTFDKEILSIKEYDSKYFISTTSEVFTSTDLTSYDLVPGFYETDDLQISGSYLFMSNYIYLNNTFYDTGVTGGYTFRFFNNNYLYITSDEQFLIRIYEELIYDILDIEEDKDLQISKSIVFFDKNWKPSGDNLTFFDQFPEAANMEDSLVILSSSIYKKQDDIWEEKLDPSGGVVDVDYKADIYFIVTGSGDIYKSSDKGKNWDQKYTIPQDDPTIIEINSIDPNIVVASGYTTSDSYIYYSTDSGDTWTEGESLSAEGTAITFFDRNFVLGQGDGKILTSKDGINWTERATPGGWVYAVFNLGKFLVAAAGNKLYKSENIDDWTEVFDAGGNYTNYSAAYFGNKYYMIMGDNFIQSTDAESWEKINLDSKETPWVFPFDIGYDTMKSLGLNFIIEPGFY